MVIGLPSGAKAEELDPQDIHEKFVKKLAQVTTQIFECRYFIHCSLRPQCQTQRWTQGYSMKHISCWSKQMRRRLRENSFFC